MALTLLKHPPALSPAGNDILFKIQTDNQFETAGAVATMVITWSQGDTLDTPTRRFTINWGENAVMFQAVTTPDGSGTQYPRFVGGSLNDWIASLVTFFQANYLLSKDFHIVLQPFTVNRIIFVARNKGSDYTLSLTDITGSYVSDFSNSAGTDPVPREFYQILARIWMEDELLGEDRLTPDADGIVKFRVQEYLKPELSSAFTWPEDNEALVKIHSDFVKQYWIEYADTYGGTVNGLMPLQHFLQTYTFPGKITKPHEVALASIGLTLQDELAATGMFLTWHQGVKVIGKTHPEKLYFLMSGETQSGGIYCRITYADGLKTNKTLYIGTITQYNVYEICCGHDAMQLQWGNPVVSLEVYVMGAEGLISMIKEFRIDPLNQENERVFLFLNSLGAYETLRTTGVHEKENLINHTIVELAKEEGDISYSAEANQESFMEESFKANTGWISKEEVDWVNDFLTSTERHIFDDYRLIEVLVTSTRVFQHRDDAMLYFVEFEYKMSRTAGYSKLTINPLLTERGEPILTQDEEMILI